jgi:hypothetical protein
MFMEAIIRKEQGYIHAQMYTNSTFEKQMSKKRSHLNCVKGRKTARGEILFFLAFSPFSQKRLAAAVLQTTFSKLRLRS